MVKDLKIRFVISTKSGKGFIAESLKEAILQAFAHLETPDICFTQRAHHVYDLCKEWAERYEDQGLVYVCGGDGTLSEASAALAQTKTYMGIIPIGTGNDFARFIYGEESSPKLINRLIALTPYPRLDAIDLLKVNDGWAINVLSMGHDAVVLDQALKNLKNWSGWGKFSYLIAVFQTLFVDKVYHYVYDFLLEDGSRMSGEMEATVSVIANGKYYGGGFTPAPAAVVDDGVADIILAKRLTFRELVPLLIKYKKGEHLGHPKIINQRIVKGVIRNKNHGPMMANYDGIVFNPESITVEVVPDALNFAYLEEGR